MIMKVAVPRAKHSPKFGQDASSQTVCRSRSRNSRFNASTLGEVGAFALIQRGLGAGLDSAGAMFTVRRAVLSLPRCALLFGSMGGLSFGGQANSASLYMKRLSRWGRKASAVAPTDSSTPRSANCVTSRPGKPQGLMRRNGDKSMQTFRDTP